jgi:hypothetical protein
MRPPGRPPSTRSSGTAEERAEFRGSRDLSRLGQARHIEAILRGLAGRRRPAHHMMRTCTWCLGAILALLPPMAVGTGTAAAAHAVSGAIYGRVIDWTVPAHPLSGQTVRLTIVERGSSSQTRTATDSAGRFSFTGLPLDGIRVFLADTEYAGVWYGSDRIVLTPELPHQEAPLIVYEATANRASLEDTVAFAVVEIAPGAVRVSVVEQFENAGDRTIVSTARDPLVFLLPPRAGDVRFLDGWRAPNEADGRIVDTVSMPPGITRLSYSFRIETVRPSLRLPWQFPYGVRDAEVLVQDVGPRVTADGLHAGASITQGNRRYQRWSAGSIPPGGGVAILLTRLPAARDPWPGAIAVGLALILAGGLGTAIRRPHRT